MAPGSEAFIAALSHHQAGRLAETERLYWQVCTADPKHAERLHYPGVLAAQKARNDAAIALMGLALMIQAGYAEALYKLGRAVTTRVS